MVVLMCVCVLFDRNPRAMKQERGLLWPLEISSGIDRSEQKVRGQFGSISLTPDSIREDRL